MPDLKIVSLRKIGKNSKNSKFRYKSSEYQNFTGFFCLYRRKMVIPTCSVSFCIIVCRYFSKWRINVFLKLKRLQQPPSPSDFDSLPYPRVRWYPQFFFMKMTAKDVKEITYMPLVTFFSVFEQLGKNRKGGCNNPSLVRRGLRQCSDVIDVQSGLIKALFVYPRAHVYT